MRGVALSKMGGTFSPRCYGQMERKDETRVVQKKFGCGYKGQRRWISLVIGQYNKIER